MSDLIATETMGAAAWVRLNRPEKRNALTRQLLCELEMGLDKIARDQSVRVVVLAANGPAFCAGMDLGEMQQRAESVNGKAEWQSDSEVYCRVLTGLFSLRVPTIAAVNGPAMAGGVGLVLACDLVIASETAIFALPEPARGIVAAMVTPLLVHRVGAGAATRMLLSGERFSAQQSQQMGLVHATVPAIQLDGRVGEAIQSILSGSREALAITKAHIAAMAGSQMAEQLEASVRISAVARETADAREGLEAFLQKRKPAWQTE